MTGGTWLWQAPATAAILGVATAFVAWVLGRAPAPRGVGKAALGVLLALATLLLLSSIGGAMAYGWPFLVPLHWYAARRSGPWMKGIWTAFAAFSSAEAVFIYLYMVTGSDAWIIPLILGPFATIVVFVATTSSPMPALTSQQDLERF
jgi:hypothetical protein